MNDESELTELDYAKLKPNLATPEPAADRTDGDFIWEDD